MPYDHAAAGFVLTFILLKIINPALMPDQIQSLLYWSLFWAVIVDWDMIISYGLMRSLKMGKVSHRSFPSHAPLPWIIFILLVYFLANSLYGKYFAVAIAGGAGSHLLVDTIEHGIMWLWPFSKKQYMLYEGPPSGQFSEEKNLLIYYAKMFRYVYMRMRSFKVGLAVVAAALVIFFGKL